jgi:hypothetical protein
MTWVLLLVFFIKLNNGKYVFLKRESFPADTVWVSRANAMQRKGRAGRVRQALQFSLKKKKFFRQYFLFCVGRATVSTYTPSSDTTTTSG